MPGHSCSPTEDSVSIADEALRAAEVLGDVPVIVDMMTTKGTALGGVGRSREGKAIVKGAAELAEENDLPLAALRAYNNLSLAVALDDPRASMAIHEAAYHKALQLDDPGYVERFTVIRYSDFVESGRFEEADSLVADTDITRFADSWRSWFEHLIALAQCNRGDDAHQTARESVTFMIEGEEPQMVRLGRSSVAEVDLLEQDFDRAYEEALDARGLPPYSDGLWTALRAAALSGRPDRLDAIVSIVADEQRQGRVSRSLLTAAVAASAGLRGQLDESVAGFESVIALWEQIELEVHTAEMKALFALVVGHDRPEAAKAAQEASDFLHSVGANGIIDLYGDVLRVDLAAEAV